LELQPICAMKGSQAKYIYPLVVLSILISIGLQIVWISQFFTDEKQRTSNEIEDLVAVVAQKSTFISLGHEYTNVAALNNFMLSPAWRDLYKGYSQYNTKNVVLSKVIDVEAKKDSSTVYLEFTFKPRGQRVSAPSNFAGLSAEVQRKDKKLDSLSLLKFKGTIKKSLDSLGLHSKYFVLMSAPSDQGFISHDPNLDKRLKSYEFVSRRFRYSYCSRQKVQLVISSVTGLVLFKMRYYLLSSFLMVLVVAVAFYFILRLMITRRMYADSRVAFTSNMTHEIKTPIATVALALESISKYELINDPEKMERYLNMGKQELQRLSHLVEKVLSLSQEDDQIKLNPVFYDVQAGLADVIHSMELPLKNAGAVCELVVSPEPCFIEGDAVHLTTVFFNLIENAIKYALDPLKLIITCSCNDDWISISFADNGPGIPEIYQQKIFERYFRIPQPGQTHPVKGSGLGLNYVFGVIQSHHGTIMLKSEMGLGSTFTIKLPGAKYEG